WAGSMWSSQVERASYRCWSQSMTVVMGQSFTVAPPDASGGSGRTFRRRRCGRYCTSDFRVRAHAPSRRRPAGFRVLRGHRAQGVPEQSRQPVGLGLLAMMRWAAGFEVLVGGRPVVGHGIDVVPLQAVAAVTSRLDTAQAVEVGRRTQLEGRAQGGGNVAAEIRHGVDPR